MAREGAARHFEGVAGTYTELRGSWLNGVLRRQEQRAVRALAAIEPGAVVLDAGCGDGETLAWLGGLGARAFGFDLVEPMAAHCRRRGLEVCVQDMENPGFRPAFDWVLCIGSLEFTADPGRAIAGFASCLRRPGRLVLLFPRRGLLGRVYAAYHRSHGVDIWLFSRRDVERMLAAAGLRPSAWRDCALSSVVLADFTAPGAAA